MCVTSRRSWQVNQRLSWTRPPQRCYHPYRSLVLRYGRRPCALRAVAHSQQILVLQTAIIACLCRPRPAHATGKFSWRAGTVVPTGTIAARPAPALAEKRSPSPLAALPRPRAAVWPRGPSRATPSPLVTFCTHLLQSVLIAQMYSCSVPPEPLFSTLIFYTAPQDPEMVMCLKASMLMNSSRVTPTPLMPSRQLELGDAHHQSVCRSHHGLLSVYLHVLMDAVRPECF